ncbi:MAG: sterol desaturase family protein [Sphingomonadales bacterium]|nr:sterol desaturase family protein [Sphingomonadales bacterium]
MQLARIGFWKNKSHYLNKMTFRELVAAYFQYYAIQTYILLGVASVVVALLYGTALLPNVIAAVLAVVIYPLVWYALHRWILHSQFMYKSPLTAKVWKRIHFDHHQDPHHLEVLFGALYTTLPTIMLATMPIGWLLDGIGGAASALAAGLFTTCFYEFCHCVQHLSFKPKQKWLADIKQRHMAHHFHNEKGNFGITNFFWDKAFGTFYEHDQKPEKSATVFNLGYDKDMAERYPWVAGMTADMDSTTPRERRENRAA